MDGMLMMLPISFTAFCSWVVFRVLVDPEPQEENQEPAPYEPSIEEVYTDGQGDA
jgi:hypothetical protein